MEVQNKVDDNKDTQKALKKALVGAGLKKISSDVLSKCVAVSSAMNLSTDQMAESWEAFSLTKNVTELTEHNFASYRTILIKQSQVSASASSGAILTGDRKRANESNLVTPPPKKAHSRTANDGADALPIPTRNLDMVGSVPNPPKYNERVGAGRVVATYNPNNITIADRTAFTAKRCVVSNDFSTNAAKPCRHMFTTLLDRAERLDEQLVSLSKVIAEKYSMGPEGNEIAPVEEVGIPCQDKITCIGRICNEAHDGRLNSTSVVLEGAAGTSGGARVNVDLTWLKNEKRPFSLFPGQIVAIEGMNVTGRKLTAQRVWEGAPQTSVASSVKELRNFATLQDEQPLRIVVASGPYTTSNNTNYEPLIDLMTSISDESPDVVIFAGPFVDMRQKDIKMGKTQLELQDGEFLTVPNEVFFANKVATLIEEVFVHQQQEKGANFHTQFILTPSLDDATAANVFPQPPLEDRVSSSGMMLDDIPGSDGVEVGTLGLQRINATFAKSGIVCLPNPCTFKVNETVIGLTSVDSLFHLSTEETNDFLEPGSRLRRISQHLIHQRSYYPLFPPPANMPVNLDMKQIDKISMPCQPDILVVPSKLTTFAANVSNSLVVNPGHLARGTTGGTYAVIDVNPVKRDTLENAGGDDVLIPNDIAGRSRVEVKRI